MLIVSKMDPKIHFHYFEYGREQVTLWGPSVTEPGDSSVYATFVVEYTHAYERLRSAWRGSPERVSWFLRTWVQVATAQSHKSYTFYNTSELRPGDGFRSTKLANLGAYRRNILGEKSPTYCTSDLRRDSLISEVSVLYSNLLDSR